MNQFLLSAVNQIKRHGQSFTYEIVQEGEYDVETGSTINTKTDFSVTMYKKHIKSNQYSYPDLVGKDAAIFYLANNGLSFVPSIRDNILVNGTDRYGIDSIVEHSALGQVILYKLIAVKS